MKATQGTRIHYLSLPLFVALTSMTALADITGVVYKDFDINGEQNGGDTVISNVKISAVCDDGTHLSTTTNTKGEYTLSGFAKGSTCRVEADPSNAGVGSGANAHGSAPLVDRVVDGTTHNISTGSPATYCQENPDVILAATPGWFTDDDKQRTSPEGYGTIFKIPTPTIGDFNKNDTIGTKRTVLTNAEDTGAVWGAAWKKSTQELFVSSVIRRYVPLHEESSDPATAAGSIYKVLLDGSLSRFAVVEDVITSDDEAIIKHRNYDENEDTDIKELVGTKGLGDLDISEDNRFLYTINLKNKTLIKIDAITGDILATTAIPNPYGGACSDAMVRPWALKVRGDGVFIGSVCEDEILEGDDPTDASAGGLGAMIQKYDGTHFSTFAQTNTLRYLRSKGYNPKESTNMDYQNTDWSHGRYEWLPQPMLTDIEFANNGDLVLGYTDRSIMIRERGGSHGDIRKMCLNEDGTYTDESTNRVPTNCSSTKLEYKDNSEEYYEFYVGDYFNGYLGEDGHPETASGALAQAPGQENIIVGMVDGTDWYQPGSIGLYSHIDGDKIAAQAVIDNRLTTDGGEQEPFAAKAGGMGDVELLCDPAPIEIGNYVWMDLDEDGIQDPNEPPLQDVNVTLSCGDPKTTYGVATTDKNGHYYFGGKHDINLNAGKVITAELPCELSLKKADVNDKDASLHNPNSDRNDTIDNDAHADGDYNLLSFTTTASSDHSFDFGILPARGCVSGQLFEDTNDDTTFNGTDKEAPSNITLNLKDAYGTHYTTQTNEDGIFSLEGILAGEVTLSIDTADTDIPDGSVWSDPGSSVTLILTEGNSSAGTCSQNDFPYTLPEEKERDPKDVAVCANPTSLTWEGSHKSTATHWQDLLTHDLNAITTASGNPVTVSMHIEDTDGKLYDTDTDNSSGSGTAAAFSEPYLTLYLGNQEDAGDGTWSDAGACDAHGYALQSGESLKLIVDFNESVVLDNWRIRDVDSGDVRQGDSQWEWQDGIHTVAYDSQGNEVTIESKIGDSGRGLLQDAEGIVHTDKDLYDAGEGDFITGEGTSPGETNGHIVLTSNFVPIKQLVITHSAGPDVPCQTRSALALTGFAVCKPLHIAGTIYDDADGTDQASCSNNDTIDGEPISQIEGQPLHACLVDEDSVVLAVEPIQEGKYDFNHYLHPNTTYGVILTTTPCTIGNSASSGRLAEGWHYEGETYTTSPDGTLDGYVDVRLEESSEMQIDFAINKAPLTQDYTRTIALNPKGSNQVDFVVDGSQSEEFIDDFEQGSDVTIKIVRIAGGSVYYNGTKLSREDTLSNPDLTQLTIDPDEGDVKVTLTYSVVDSACRLSNEARFTARFTTLYIAGNLFLDKSRNDTVDGRGTPYSCDGSTPLYINLLDSDDKVLASKALDEEGGYAFFSADGVADNQDYTLRLSTIQGAKGDDAPSTQLPAGCIHGDGEHIGTTAGHDAQSDGTIAVSVEEENLLEINFAITPTISLGNRLWIEDDNDGNASTGTITPARYIPVALSCANGYRDNTITGEHGYYLFTLPINMGACTLTTEVPAQTSPSTGSDDDRVTDTFSENDLTHDHSGTTIEVGEQDNLTLDFGFASVGKLCGNVSEDRTGDGVGDVMLSQVALTLYDASDAIIATTQTDTQGDYCFSNLSPALYRVVETQPTRLIDLFENEGGDDNDNGDDTRVNSILAYIDAGETDSGNDFIEEAPASLGDRVWYDDDANGLQESDEIGVEGITVTLLDANDQTIATTTTDSSGLYHFDMLSSGLYTVAFDTATLPEGYTITSLQQGSSATVDSDAEPTTGRTPRITLHAGDADMRWDMGIHHEEATPNTPYLIGTHFWIDSDKNGQFDAGEESIEGALIELFDANGQKLYWSDAAHTALTTTPTQWVAETYTDADGAYHFNVPAGTYQVRFNIPNNKKYAGYVFDTPNQNSDDAQNINTTNSKGFTQTVTVGRGHENTKSLTLDAGINCGCEDAPIKSNGADALGLISMLSMMLMTLLTALFFVRKEEEQTH